MKGTLVKTKGIPAERVRTIPPWGRPELLSVGDGGTTRQELDVGADEVLLVYAGNMGVMHPLGPILDAAVSLKREPVRFLFIGDGASRPALISRASIEGLDRVSFSPVSTGRSIR